MDLLVRRIQQRKTVSCGKVLGDVRQFSSAAPGNKRCFYWYPHVKAGVKGVWKNTSFAYPFAKKVQ